MFKSTFYSGCLFLGGLFFFKQVCGKTDDTGERPERQQLEGWDKTAHMLEICSPHAACDFLSCIMCAVVGFPFILNSLLSVPSEVFRMCRRSPSHVSQRNIWPSRRSHPCFLSDLFNSAASPRLILGFNHTTIFVFYILECQKCGLYPSHEKTSQCTFLLLGTLLTQPILKIRWHEFFVFFSFFCSVPDDTWNDDCVLCKVIASKTPSLLIWCSRKGL